MVVLGIFKGYFTPFNLINIQGHELEGAFIVHAFACLDIYGQITHKKYVPNNSLFQFLKESLALLLKSWEKELELSSFKLH